MFTKSTIALALILATASGSIAATKNAGTNPSFNVYDSRGNVIGADPDPRIRMELQRDHGATE
jgi:hypothetical protein